MKFVVVLISALLSLSSSAFAQTRLDSYPGACVAYQKADAELNKTYHAILKKKQGDVVFLMAIKKAHRAWVAFKGAEIEAVYPGSDKQLQYGSAYSMCACGLAAKLTQERVVQLKTWLISEEGDVCNGSKWP